LHKKKSKARESKINSMVIEFAECGKHTHLTRGIYDSSKDDYTLGDLLKDHYNFEKVRVLIHETVPKLLSCADEVRVTEGTHKGKCGILGQNRDIRFLKGKSYYIEVWPVKLADGTKVVLKENEIEMI